MQTGAFECWLDVSMSFWFDQPMALEAQKSDTLLGQYEDKPWHCVSSAGKRKQFTTMVGRAAQVKKQKGLKRLALYSRLFYL